MKIKCSLFSFDLFELCVTFKRVKLSSNRPKMFKTYQTCVLFRNFSFYKSCNSLGVYALRGDPTITHYVSPTQNCSIPLEIRVIMSANGAGESMKSEIDRVRDKLLKTSCIETETKEYKKETLGVKKEKMSDNDQHGRENAEIIKCPIGGDLKGKKRELEADKIVSPEFSEMGKQNGVESKAAMDNPFTANARQGHAQESAHDNAKLPHDNTVGGSRDRLISSSAAFSVCHPAKGNNTESPQMVVDVSVNDLQQHNEFVSLPAQIIKETPGKNIQQRSDSLLASSNRRTERCPSRFSQKLSKSPISVITLSSAGKCEEMCPNHGTPFSKPGEKASQVATSKFHSESEPKISEDSQNYERSDAITDERQRPTVRRRLSKTIQHLQEKIQKEIENNENKIWKQSDTNVKNFEPQRLSAKVSSRFARERSRKRSKSRVGYKVLQSTRKYPLVHTKERPYRQWMGVGNCVAHDTRFIVASSNCSQDNICLTKQGISPRRNNVEGPNGLSEIVLHKSKECVWANMNEEEKNKDHYKLMDATKEEINKGAIDLIPNSNNVSECDRKEELNVDEHTTQGELEQIQKPNEDNLHNSRCVSTVPTSTTPWASELNNDKKLGNGRTVKTSSPTRERSRCMRRSALHTDKRIRPPTPHSGFSSGNVKNSKLPFNKSKPRTSSKKRIASGTLGSPGHVLSVSRNFQVPGASERKPPGFSRGGLPSKPEFNDIMRSSKRFTAAPKQQRKPNRAAHPCNVCKENAIGLPSKNIDKNATLDTASSSPCDANSLRSGETGHHGSLETLWSDVSTTTWESSVKTESSSSWYHRDVSGNHDESPQKQKYCHLSPRTRLPGPEVDASEKAFEAGGTDRTIHTRKYVDVQVIFRDIFSI